MITADLDQQLAASVRALIADGTLPPAAARARAAGTWRPAQDGDPLGYATALPLELAWLTGTDPAGLASALAAAIRPARWLEVARPDGGYLTVTVTAHALATSAAMMAATGPDCAGSTILAGTSAQVRPWPALAAAASWQEAWQDQAGAMTGRLARAAGATVTSLNQRKRGNSSSPPLARARLPVQPAVAFLGIDSVRYLLARTRPADLSSAAAAETEATPTPAEAGGQPAGADGRAAGTGGRAAGSGGEAAGAAGRAAGPGGRAAGPGGRAAGAGGRAAGGAERPADPLYAVQQAAASAASALRWAADLGLARAYPAGQLGELLASPAERALLSLLSYLPVRVAAAARRHRPDDLPAYLEVVSAAWQVCVLEAPALPFGGIAAPRDPAIAAARLELAAAVSAVLTAALALTGIAAPSRL